MEPYPVQVHVRVRGSDLGPDGQVHEASLLAYFHEARRAYFGALNAGDDGFHARVVSASLTVLRPATVGDELAVRARVDELASMSLRMVYLVRDRLTGLSVTQGETTLMMVDPAGEDRKIPSRFRERVQALEGRNFPLPS